MNISSKTQKINFRKSLYFSGKKQVKILKNKHNRLKIAKIDFTAHTWKYQKFNKSHTAGCIDQLKPFPKCCTFCDFLIDFKLFSNEYVLP